MQNKLSRNNVAIYCRLSVDDGINQESQSISNQKQVLTKYAFENGFQIYDIYIDDGYTGTNFDRPDFKRMIQDIERGYIDIVITKDLSRLGRDYLETGYYTERYFVEKGIRYIALNDNVDTDKGLDDFMPIKNIMNEYYAKDISKKISFTFENSMKEGKFSNSKYPLYGYKNENNQRVIDEEAAAVVRKIFSLFIEGYSIKGIVDYLYQNKIPTPFAYLESKGFNVNKKTDPYLWHDNSIRLILKNSEYLGHYYRKKSHKRFKSHKSLPVPKEEQYFFPNRFEPIIDEDTYNLAQELFNKGRNNSSLINPFSKIAYCGICGKPLILKRSKNGNGYYEERLICKHSNEIGKASILLSELKEVVAIELLALKEVIHANEKEFKIEATKLLEKETLIDDDMYQKNQIRKKRIDARLIELNKYLTSLFEKQVDTPINLSTYKKMVEEYTSEIKLLEEERNRIDLFNVEKEKETNMEESYNHLLDVINNINKDNITSNYIVRNIIQKIIITTFDEPNSTHNRKGKNITIIYKCLDNCIKEFLTKGGTANESSNN